jgi:hypothetical protein
MRIHIICVVYEFVEVDFVVAGIEEVDADPVVDESIASNSLVVGIEKVDAFIVVAADIVACYGVVAGT